MKPKFEKRLWFEAKQKLSQLYSFLGEQDFHYEPGKENRMLERIRTKLNIPQKEFYHFIGLAN